MTELSKAAKNLWGKKRIENENELWLPLIAHMIDTKNVINWLFNNWLNLGQKEILISGSDENQISKLINFMGFIHDIGKATPAFQTKSSYDHNKDLDADLIERLINSGFSGLNNLILASRKESPHAVAGEAILEDRDLETSLGAVIGGHHGKPQDSTPRTQIKDFTKNYYQVEGKKEKEHPEIRKRWQSVQNELINYGLKICKIEKISDLPKISQPQAVILEGLVITADWLASSEYFNDDKNFPMFTLIPLNKEFDDLNMQDRFTNAMSNWISDSWVPKMIIDPDKQYEKRWGFSPRPVQAKMSEEIQKSIDPGLIIIEAPMGIGKTEIALTAVEQLAFSTGRNGLFFGLPTQATSDAMFSRVDQWLNQIATSNQEKLQIKLMHGKAQFNREYQKLPEAKNVDSNSSVVINSWFSGKKSILTEFTIGTIDNLLSMSLKQRHLFLKHLGFSGKIVVIDEVHAYDAYMNSYLTKTIKWLGAYHVPVIALSATLPSQKRAQLLKAYCSGKYGKSSFSAPDNWENNQSYPLLSILDGRKLIQISDFNQDKQDTSQVSVKRFNGDNEQLVNLICNSICDGGVAGVIVNTVKRAQELAQEIPNDIPKLVLHSAFLAPDRSKIEQKLQNLIGKKGKRPNKLVVIGTQVLEQSLDIDFDILFTDIAPMDLILQRIGRLHRHQIKRPKNLMIPQVYILGINSFGDYGEANESIYEKYLLMKTDHYLKSSICIPNDISTLVQAVYDSENDGKIEGVKQEEEKFNADIEKENNKAKVFQIQKPKISHTIHGWLRNDRIGADKDETKAEAAVRDIKETIEIVLLKKNKDGKYYLLDGRPITKVADKEITQQIIRLPNVTTQNISQCIDELEAITHNQHPGWQESIWLKGDLSLALDENNHIKFNGWILSYSPQLGLIYEKEGLDE